MKLTAILLTVLISVVSAEQPAESNLRVLAKARVEERATNIFNAKAALEAEAEDSLLESEEGTEDRAGMTGRRRRRWGHGHRPHAHLPHGHHPHGHRPHAHVPHVHVCNTIDHDLTGDAACCSATKTYGSCSATVDMCFGLRSPSVVKANVCGAKALIKLAPNISTTVTADCSTSFTVAEDKEKKIFSYGLAKAEIGMGYSFDFNAGLTGSVTLSMSPAFVVGVNWGSPSGSMAQPSLVYDGSGSITVNAEMYVGLGMSAIEVIGIGADARMSTDGEVSLTSSGLSANAGMSASIVGRAALQFPDLSLPSVDICAEDLSFGSFSMPSVGGEINIWSTSW